MKNAREKIIVSADDFGLRLAANEQILELARLGKVDRIAVLVDGLLADGEIKALRGLNVKIDIHLDWETHKSSERNLTEGIALRAMAFLAGYYSGRISGEKIKQDWHRQLYKFKEIFGKYPDGINSHQHMHFFPSYFPVVIEFAKKTDISYVRFGSKNVILSGKSISWILYFFHRWNKKKYSASGANSSDHLISLDWIGDIEKFFACLPEGKTEIVCHPERPEEFELIKKYF